MYLLFIYSNYSYIIFILFYIETDNLNKMVIDKICSTVTIITMVMVMSFNNNNNNNSNNNNNNIYNK